VFNGVDELVFKKCNTNDAIYEGGGVRGAVKPRITVTFVIEPPRK